MKTVTRYLNQYALAAVFTAGVLAIAAGPADAAPRGPQASVASSTTCALSYDYTQLIITTSLTDKSSGANVDAEVRGGEIQATYKPLGKRGNTSVNFTDGDPAVDETYIIGGTDLGPIGDGKDIQAEYYLCDPAGVDGVRKEVSGGRELNATSTVEYGMVGESELNKSVLNRCSADPDTGLGGGIRVADVYDAIVAACAP